MGDVVPNYTVRATFTQVAPSHREQKRVEREASKRGQALQRNLSGSVLICPVPKTESQN